MKLFDLKSVTLNRPTSVEGIFMKPLSFAALRALQGREMEGEDDTLELILYCFQNIFVDKEGNSFEDVNTIEDVGEIDIEICTSLFNDISSVTQSPNSQENQSDT